jgi:hypothetical protein
MCSCASVAARGQRSGTEKRARFIRDPRTQRKSPPTGRERARCKAEELLARVKRGLGGRYYKSKSQVDRRVGQIIARNIQALITVNVATCKAKRTLSWEHNHRGD